MYKIIILAMLLVMSGSCITFTDRSTSNEKIPEIRNDGNQFPFPARDEEAGLPVEIGELKFFETDSKKVTPKNKRVYVNTFKSKSRAIFSELGLTPKDRGQTDVIVLENIYYHPSGSVFCQAKNSFTVQDALTSTNTGCIPDGGVWNTGTYRVVFRVNDREVAKGFFTIEN